MVIILYFMEPFCDVFSQFLLLITNPVVHIFMGIALIFWNFFFLEY